MTKMRSPNYPAIGLREAVLRAKSLWAKEKRTPVPADVAAKAIGYGSLNGPSRSALASLKKFGLVDSDDKTVRISELALKIFHPASEQEELIALQESALKPELFSQLVDSHFSASDDAIRSYLITKLGFSEGGAKQVIKALRDTLSFAKLDNPEYNPEQSLAQETTMQAIDNTQSSGSITGHRIGIASTGNRTGQTGTSSQTFSWPVGAGVSAEVRFTGGALKPEYFDALRQYLELAQRLVKNTSEPGDNPLPRE